MYGQPLPRKEYTFEDWENLPDDGKKYELIDGDLYMMAQPSIIHQEAAVDITAQLRTYLRGKQCRVIAEPSVRIKKRGKYNAFIPDIAMVCDTKKIKQNYIDGPPDLIVEVLSPSTAIMDKLPKLNAYKDAGVREYWIVDPVYKTIDSYCWEKSLAPVAYGPKDKLKPSIFGDTEDFELDLALVFLGEIPIIPETDDFEEESDEE